MRLWNLVFKIVALERWGWSVSNTLFSSIVHYGIQRNICSPFTHLCPLSRPLSVIQSYPVRHRSDKSQAKLGGFHVKFFFCVNWLSVVSLRELFIHVSDSCLWNFLRTFYSSDRFFHSVVHYAVNDSYSSDWQGTWYTALSDFTCRMPMCHRIIKKMLESVVFDCVMLESDGMCSLVQASKGIMLKSHRMCFSGSVSGV